MRARRLSAPRLRRHTSPPTLAGILAVVRDHHPGVDVSAIEHAHGGRLLARGPNPPQLRCVAAIVAGVGMPPPAVCAAMLHDIHDTSCPPDRVADRFGQDIAELVSAVRTAELSGIAPRGLPSEVARQPLQPSREEAVLAIHLADRLHNMRTIAFLAQAK